MNNKKYYKYIFVVLLYKNMSDVLEMLESVDEKMDDYHVILVNSFYDEETNETARAIAEKSRSCSFISVANKGYGAGNNAGIAYANEYYDYDYVIISNPDIVIRNFDESALLGADIEAVYAPKIISRDHKRQNPNWGVHSDFLEHLQYLACKTENKFLDYSVIAILKIIRLVYGYLADIFHIHRLQIGNAHGSFVVLSKAAVEKIAPLYDENMFLFYEEVYLGNKTYRNKIPTYYVPDILIHHKEDGSMQVANVNTRKEAHKSVVYYFEHKSM